MTRWKAIENLEEGVKIYFMGIAGTGMAAVAGLMQEAGYNVCGSDNEIYPPMSTMLQDLNIEVSTPYKPTNISDANPDLVVIANCLSKGHPEISYVLENNIPYTSFPELLGHCFLKKRTSVVVAGTHGKTTTSSILTHVLREIGADPGYMIGGVPVNFERSFHLGKGQPFVIEGDEYDTAFFDKESKFLHYKPNFLVLNNVEFDHADIFMDLAAVEHMFGKFLDLASVPQNIIANVDDPGVKSLLVSKGLLDKVTTVAARGIDLEADVVIGEAEKLPVQDVSTADSSSFSQERPARRWRIPIKAGCFGNISLETSLIGSHNYANIAQVIGCLVAMKNSSSLEGQLVDNPRKFYCENESESESEKLAKYALRNQTTDQQKIVEAVASFQGVKRRFEHIAKIDDIDIYEDFAHHPTAVGLMIESFRKAFPSRRLVVAFEPRNATARRNIFEDSYTTALGAADEVLLGNCPIDLRIPEKDRMTVDNIESSLRQKGTSATAFGENTHLLRHLVNHLKSGDSVIFMSSGSFSGIQYELADALIAARSPNPSMPKNSQNSAEAMR